MLQASRTPSKCSSGIRHSPRLSDNAERLAKRLVIEALGFEALVAERLMSRPDLQLRRQPRLEADGVVSRPDFVVRVAVAKHSWWRSLSRPVGFVGSWMEAELVERYRQAAQARRSRTWSSPTVQSAPRGVSSCLWKS